MLCRSCSSVLPNFRCACGLPVLVLLLLPLLGSGGAWGEELLPPPIRLPPAPPIRLALPSPPVERPVVIITTIDGDVHALELKTGVLRWTVPSGDPVVNFEKPDEKRPDGVERGTEALTGSREDTDAGIDVGGPGLSLGTMGSDSTDVSVHVHDARPWKDVNDARPWKEQEVHQPREDEFEGFIPVYSGIPGGGFLSVGEDGKWKIFEASAEDLVTQSPWYDKASRGIIVGAKATKVFALDPETGKLSWDEDASSDSESTCTQSGTKLDNLIVTRSIYSIKVRNAETGAFFWNVSISEFRTHTTEPNGAPGEANMEMLLVTSTDGNELKCFDRSSGNLRWKHMLPAAAVSAHVWERNRAMEIHIHAHDQAELVVASDSTSVAAASSVRTVHVHKHNGGLYARMHAPMGVPTKVAQKILDSSRVSGALQSLTATELSIHVEGVALSEILVKRNQNTMPCKPKSPDYPDCLVGTYDIAWDADMPWPSLGAPVVSDQQGVLAGGLVRKGEAGAEGLGRGDEEAGRMWSEVDFLDRLQNPSTMQHWQEQVENLLRLAEQTPILFVGLVVFLIFLGWFLGRKSKGTAEDRQPRLSEASSSNSLIDLHQVPQHLIENGTMEQQCNSDDKDSGSLSKATTPGEDQVPATSRRDSLEMSNSSWGEKWGDKSSENENGKGNNSYSFTDSDADEFNTESIDKFPNDPVTNKRVALCTSGSSKASSKASSRVSSATTAKPVRGAQKGQGKTKNNPKVHIPDPGAFMYGGTDMKSLCAQLDDDGSFGGNCRRQRRRSSHALSRDGSDENDDESWAGEIRQRSISLGSNLASARSTLNDDLAAALAAPPFPSSGSSSVPTSPKTTPSSGFVMSPGFSAPLWIESRYQKDFEELGRIGKGAFGSVYRVKHRVDEREYAVKKVRLERDLQSADNQRIIREVRSFSILSDHPKIVRYYGAWQEKEMPQNDAAGGGDNSTVDGSAGEVTWDQSSMVDEESDMTQAATTEPVNWLYIQMELCSTSLRQLLNAVGKEAWSVDRDRIRRYLHDVSEGLSYIHSKHYIHRDMKPDNIFVVDNHGTLVAKLGDFGLSCKTNPEKAEGGSAENLTPLMREGSGEGQRQSMLSFSGSLSSEDMDAVSLAELTRACGTRMYFSPELEHSGVYNQLVDVYALGIVMFEMMHVFKTGMERIKVIEQLKSAMCTPQAADFSAMPLKYILVHTNASSYDNAKANSSPRNHSKPSTPSSDRAAPARQRRPFERGDDSGGDSPSDSSVSSPLPLRPTSHGSAETPGARPRPTHLDCNLSNGSPGAFSPVQGDEHMGKENTARTDKLRALLEGMTLPSEVMDLFATHEFEVSLLLRLLSQVPERRPSAQDMRDELVKSLQRHRSLLKVDEHQEVQKLRQQVAELTRQKEMHGIGRGRGGGGGGTRPGSDRLDASHLGNAPPALSPPNSPGVGLSTRQNNAMKNSHSEANLRSHSMDAKRPL